MERGKEFQSNGITSIAIHPHRNEFVIVGYQYGQISMFDVTDPSKSIKIIRDANRTIPIVRLSFVEWHKSKKIDPRQDLNVSLNEIEVEPEQTVNPYNTGSINNNPYERTMSGTNESPYLTGNQGLKKKKHDSDLTGWMFVSVDAQGRVIVHTI